MEPDAISEEHERLFHDTMAERSNQMASLRPMERLRRIQKHADKVIDARHKFILKRGMGR